MSAQPIVQGNLYRTPFENRSIIVETIYPSFNFPDSWITSKVEDGKTLIVRAEDLQPYLPSDSQPTSAAEHDVCS